MIKLPEYGLTLRKNLRTIMEITRIWVKRRLFMDARTFFGHGDCYRLDEDMLQRLIDDLI